MPHPTNRLVRASFVLHAFVCLLLFTTSPATPVNGAAPECQLTSRYWCNQVGDNVYRVARWGNETMLCDNRCFYNKVLLEPITHADFPKPARDLLFFPSLRPRDRVDMSPAEVVAHWALGTWPYADQPRTCTQWSECDRSLRVRHQNCSEVVLGEARFDTPHEACTPAHPEESWPLTWLLVAILTKIITQSMVMAVLWFAMLFACAVLRRLQYARATGTPLTRHDLWSIAVGRFELRPVNARDVRLEPRLFYWGGRIRAYTGSDKWSPDPNFRTQGIDYAHSDDAPRLHELAARQWASDSLQQQDSSVRVVPCCSSSPAPAPPRDAAGFFVSSGPATAERVPRMMPPPARGSPPAPPPAAPAPASPPAPPAQTSLAESAERIRAAVASALGDDTFVIVPHSQDDVSEGVSFTLRRRPGAAPVPAAANTTSADTSRDNPMRGTAPGGGGGAGTSAPSKDM